MKKRILVITQYFYPENFRINDLVLELKKRGYDITVLTGLPNYPQGEYYEGYSRDKNCDEIWNEIPIYRCNLRARHRGSINLIINYISFVVQANKKLKELEYKEFDLIYVFEVSPITVALSAIKLKKKKHIPIIINIQDLWPENIIAITGITNPIIISLIKKLVKYIYNSCDCILAASPSFVPNIQKYLKTDKDKVKFWPQYATVQKEEKKKDLFNKGDFNIVFTGNIGEAQGLDLVIEAAYKLKDTRIRWQLVGDGRQMDYLKQKVKEKGLENIIIFHGRKPENEIPQYLACADAALLILKPNPIFEMTIPAKLQTYMACGVPILGCVSGEGKKVIELSQSGLVSTEISVQGLIQVCKQILEFNKKDYELLQKNSLVYGRKVFNKDILINMLMKEMEVKNNNEYEI